MDASVPKPEEQQPSPPAPSQVSPEHPFFPDAHVMAPALEAGSIGIWSWDVATNHMTWSANLEEIHDLPDGSFDGTFAYFEKDMHPDDRPGVLAAMQETLRTHKPHRSLYRLPPRAEREERWIEIMGRVLLDGDRPTRMVGTCRDVTERVRLHRELRMRASQQEALARLGERALTEGNLQKFFDETVAAIADILDVELVKILELVPGDAEVLLRSGTGWKPGVVGNAYVSTSRETHAGYTLAAGGPVVVENFATETRFGTDAVLRDHEVVSGAITPIAGRDGRTYGVLGVHTVRRRRFNETDISFLVAVANVVAGAIQRLQLDQRQQLMIRELRHRSGNLFAQLLALFSQTAKTSRNFGDLVTKYEARVMAMASAHRLITEGGWKSAALTKMLETLLAPYLDRITFSGPEVFLEPDVAFGLSTAVHELATNASKFGSLTERLGTVEVSWTVDRTHQGVTLMFDWREAGGPPPKRSPRPGFGSKLIGLVIERQLNGEVRQTFEPEGLKARLIVPLTYERWPGARQPPPEDLP
jgi:PAS domain S-box-containing protein